MEKIISKLVQDIEKKVLVNKVKECEELKLLKEKCCDSQINLSAAAFNSICYLVKKRVLVGSQTVSLFISLLPTVNHYGLLITALGDVLLNDLKTQIISKGTYYCSYSKGELKHPFIIILEHNKEKSWFEIYIFILKVIENNADDIKLENKIKLLRPIFRYLFWSSSWRGSQLQLMLFNALMSHLDKKEILNFTLEVLMWQVTDVYYCLFLHDFLIHLLKTKSQDINIISALTPSLAQAIKWLIINGHDPFGWIKNLKNCIEIDNSANSIVLSHLTDVILEAPPHCTNLMINVCKSIIFSSSCNKYVAYKFLSTILNWFVNPCSLENSITSNLSEILTFFNEEDVKWNDGTSKLIENNYYKVFGSTNREIQFSINLILTSNSWVHDEKSMICWLKSLIDSSQLEVLVKLHTFIFGMFLCENDEYCINLCLEVLLKLIEHYKDISFPLLCLVFYKLGKETDPSILRTYLFTLPKLAIKKENIPLIVGIIESIKKGSKIMTSLTIHLYLLLWKFNNRTYSYLHKILHDSSSEDFTWESHVSKVIALKEICRLAPHLHAKDLVGVLSKILNECVSHDSGLPSAIAIEAVTELCKSYVIDVAGTWNAIQPKLCVDRRPQVIISLCKFFEEFPNLNSAGQKYDQLVNKIVPMLWNYTFLNDTEVTTHAFHALSKFNIENLPLKLLPETYRVSIKLPKNCNNVEDILLLPYVPAECWIQFIEKIDDKVVCEGGKLLSTIIERELQSLPRGLFYLPPEKSEPLNYSYLPQRSICRVLVEYLQKQSMANKENLPNTSKEIIRIISREYSKLLPPLNWCFTETFINVDLEFGHCILALLAKQASSSKSAKTILEKYLKTYQWDANKLEDILFLYELLPFMCKALSYNIFQNFLEETIKICLRAALDSNTCHFENILKYLRETLKNKNVPHAQKTLMAKELEKIIAFIPPEHEIMKSYAYCVTEFPIQTIERLTVIKLEGKINSSRLHQAIIIRGAIAMRTDIKNPMIWFNEFIEACVPFSNEQSLVLNTIWSIIRNRRSCDHKTWLQELTWRIQASITASNSNDSKEVTMFLLDVFLNAVILLSGFDCFFVDVNEFLINKSRKLQIFPQAFNMLLHLSDWIDIAPKIALWLQKLSKWKHLPHSYASATAQSLLTLKEAKYFSDENLYVYLFNSYSVPFS